MSTTITWPSAKAAPDLLPNWQARPSTHNLPALFILPGHAAAAAAPTTTRPPLRSRWRDLSPAQQQHRLAALDRATRYATDTGRNPDLMPRCIIRYTRTCYSRALGLWGTATETAHVRTHAGLTEQSL